MRNYVRKKQNPAYLPHEIYMQMLYLIRDYQAYGQNSSDEVGPQRACQWDMVAEALHEQEQHYAKCRESREALNALQAFFDYPYFSFMFMQKIRESGASKRSWALYRSRLAHAVAKKLELI